mgnify:CR=1 FL=1
MNNLTELFCDVDDFCQEFIPQWQQQLIASGDKKRSKPSRLSDSEIMTLIIWFHQSNFRNFKHFYLSVVQFYHEEFPQLVSYNRFVELKQSILIPLTAYLQSRYGRVTGIAYVDSTKIEVCHTKRISRNKTFEGIAAIGKSSMGWFYGFKLHLIVNDQGELLNVYITKGNTDDREPIPKMTKCIWGKLFGDKGYISQPLTDYLREQSIQLITSIKKNMKPKLMTLFDKIMLRKRSIIETINDQLKNISQIEHSRHRSINNFMVNLVAGLVAYTHQNKKPSIKMPHADKRALALF